MSGTRKQTDNDDDGLTDYPDDPDCSSATDSEIERNLDQYCNWQQIDSASKMVSCTPPNDEAVYSHPGTVGIIHDADGSNEYLKARWKATASTESCPSGQSCQADSDSVFDANAFGQPTKTLWASAKVKCGVGKSCSGGTDTVTKTAYSQSNPSGTVSMNTGPYSPGCNAEYGADSAAGYNVEVYKCVPKPNTCTTGAFSFPTDPLGQNGGSTGCEGFAKYTNGPEQVDLCIIEVIEETGKATIPKKIRLAVDGAGIFNDGQKSTTTIPVADFKAGKQTIEGRNFKLTDDPDDPNDPSDGVNEHAIADKDGDWVMDIKHYACGDGGTGDEGSNDYPDADDDGTINAGICADSSGKSIDVLHNDSDPDENPLVVTSVGDPVSIFDDEVNGSASVDPMTGEIIYIPEEAPDTVEFEYTISDANGGTDTATVRVNVTGDKSSCGELTIRVEGPNGSTTPGVGFRPKYDSDANGTTTADEKLPERGQATGKFTYNVTVDDTPRLSKMNESLITQFPTGFATSVEKFEKAVETTLDQDEPDDHTYQNQSNKKSKLATDPSGPPPPNACNDGEDNDGDGDVDSADCNCANGDTDSEASGGNCLGSCPNMSGDQVAVSEYECFADDDSDCPTQLPDQETSQATYTIDSPLQSDDVVTVPNWVTANIQDSAGDSPPPYEVYAETTVTAVDGAGNTVGQKSQRVEADVPNGNISSDTSQNWNPVELNNIGGAESLEITSEANVVYTNTGTGAYALGKATTDCPTIDSNQGPQADITKYTQGQQNQCLRLDGSGSSDPDGSIADYDWSLTTVSGGGGLRQRNGTGELSDHEFDQQDKWQIGLTVTDDNGAKNTASVTHQVEPTSGADCGSDFSWDPNWGQ